MKNYSPIATDKKNNLNIIGDFIKQIEIKFNDTWCENRSGSEQIVINCKTEDQSAIIGFHVLGLKIDWLCFSHVIKNEGRFVIVYDYEL